jgi:hypothetical protein
MDDYCGLSVVSSAGLGYFVDLEDILRLSGGSFIAQSFNHQLILEFLESMTVTAFLSVIKIDVHGRPSLLGW